MNQGRGKIPTRITDKTAPHLELVIPQQHALPNARAECAYCARNAIIGSTLVARSAGM
jgi:hypothetical protein